MNAGLGNKLIWVAIPLVIAVTAATAWFISQREHTVTAEFSAAKGLYVGDDVRMLGVPIGKVSKISTVDEKARVELSVDPDVDIPADAQALLVAQSLVSERFVQLTPVYEGGEKLKNGGLIPQERTAVPVEWDGIKAALVDLSETLGPNDDNPEGTLAKFVDSADLALDGNGQALRKTLRDLSETAELLNDSQSDFFSLLKNLQLFVTALSQSEEQIVNFGGRLASVSEILGNNTQQLDVALDDLSLALNDVERFMRNTGPTLTNSLDQLGKATNILREQRSDVEKLLHVAPHGIANFQAIYRPRFGTLNGALALNQMASPLQFVCGAVEGLANDTSDQSGALCREYLGPYLNLLRSNYPDFQLNLPNTPWTYPNQVEYAQKPGTATPDGDGKYHSTGPVPYAAGQAPPNYEYDPYGRPISKSVNLADEMLGGAR